MFKEINKMTGKVFENPENQQNMKVQVWLVEQDFPPTVSGQTTWLRTHGDMLEREPRSRIPSYSVLEKVVQTR